MLATRRGWDIFVVLPLDWVRRAWAWLEEVRHAVRTRRILATLDDHTLSDIGVSRAEVREEIRRMPWDTRPRR
jgi:uncharacterized protein YjiS (DUF1127 family)